MDAEAPVGQRLSDYAAQVAGINQKISGLMADGQLPSDDAGKASYETLKAQRDAIAAKAKGLSGRVDKTGAASPVDFGAEVKKAGAALTQPKADSGQLGELRSKYPQYNDLSDQQLADGFYKKFYSDMPRDQFDNKIGLKPSPVPGGTMKVPAAGGAVTAAKEPYKPGGDVLPYRGDLSPLPKSQMQGGTSEALGRAADFGLTGLGPAIGKGLEKVGKGISGVVGDLRGTPAKKGLETIRQETMGRMSEAAGSVDEATGKATAEAQKAVSDQEMLVSGAQAAADDLEKSLLAQPGMTKRDFGSQIYEKTVALRDKYRAIRSEQSGYDKALADAGDEPRVDTTGILAQLDDVSKRTASLTLDPLVEGVRRKLGSEIEGAIHNKMTVAQADSLRKSLDSVIQTKVMGDKAIDSEAAHVLTQVRNALTQATDDAWQPLKEARAKWAELSSPLDIVSRKGPLRKVVTVDPLSEDAAMANAQIVGHVIERAREGHGVFSRLVQESPELRESARLYFTQDLFGVGKSPTVDSLRTWLKANEEPLKQLKLYDEFRTLPDAKQAAQRAVEEAQGVLKERQGALKEKQTAESASHDYRGFVKELETKVDKQVPGAARSALKKLYDDKRLDEKVYGELLEQINQAEASGMRTKALRDRMKQVIYTAGAAYGGYEAYRGMRALMGW